MSLEKWKEQLVEWEDTNGELVVGQTIRLNHTECPEGTDTKRRLYITAKLGERDGALCHVAYCHNCSQSGFRYPGIQPAYSKLAATNHDTQDKPVELPDDIVGDISHERFPISALHWFEMYMDFSASRAQQLLKETGAGWSDSYQRIILPIYNPPYELVGWQGRSLSTYGPKYITCSGRAPLEMAVGPRIGKSGDHHVVFVEDWMSAHKFRGIANVTAVPLFGLHWRAEWIWKCVKNYGTPVVWFDNDKAAIKPREDLTRLLSALGTSPIQVCSGPEAKWYTTESLDEITNNGFIIPAHITPTTR